MTAREYESRSSSSVRTCVVRSLSLPTSLESDLSSLKNSTSCNISLKLPCIRFGKRLNVASSSSVTQVPPRVVPCRYVSAKVRTVQSLSFRDLRSRYSKANRLPADDIRIPRPAVCRSNSLRNRPSHERG